jgi:hypothetical protein
MVPEHTVTALHSSICPQKFVVAQLVMKFPTFMEPQGSLLCLQTSAVGQYLWPTESSPFTL